MARPSQKNKILQAALQCFAELGYDATRVRHIAEQAQVSEGALYRHFASKEAIAQAIYLSHLDSFSTRLQQIVSSNLPIEQKFHKVAQEFLNNYRTNPAAFTFMLLGKVTFIPEFSSDVTFPISILKSLIVKGQQAGVVREGEASLLAAIFFGCLLRPIIMSQLDYCDVPDLLHNREHDKVILDAAWAAVSCYPTLNEKGQVK